MWTYKRLAAYINKNAEVSGYARLSTISRSGIKSILEHAQIKPHKIRYYCEKRDGEFNTKMHNILVIYKHIELQADGNGQLLPSKDTKINTISYNEKPGIQAIATTTPDRMPTTANGYMTGNIM